MTDKEIIIDGVDVSGCEYLYTDSKYNDKCCSVSIGGDCLCKPSEIICIKYVEYLKEQLKRKEQECKNLEEELRGYRIGIKDISIENTEICKISEKYKRVLDEIEKFAQDIANTKEWINCTYNALKAESILDIINKAKGKK